MPSVGEFLKQPQEDGERLDWLPQSVSEPVTIISARDAGASDKNNRLAGTLTKNKNNRLAGTLTLTLDTIFSSEFSIFAMCFGSISIEHMR